MSDPLLKTKVHGLKYPREVIKYRNTIPNINHFILIIANIRYRASCARREQATIDHPISHKLGIQEIIAYNNFACVHYLN